MSASVPANQRSHPWTEESPPPLTAPQRGPEQTLHSHRLLQGPGTHVIALFLVLFLKHSTTATKSHKLQAPPGTPPAPEVWEFPGTRYCVSCTSLGLVPSTQEIHRQCGHVPTGPLLISCFLAWPLNNSGTRTSGDREQSHLQVRSTAKSQQTRVLSKEPGTHSPASPFLTAGSCQALQGAISSDH